MRLRPGIRPGSRYESLQLSPDPLGGFKGEGREGEEKWGKGQ